MFVSFFFTRCMQVFWTVSLWFMTLCELIAPNLGLISNYALFSRLVPNKFAYQRSPGQLHCDLKSSSKLDKSKWDSAVHTHVAVVRTMVIPSSPTPRGMGMGSAVAATSSIDVWIQLVDPPKHLILRPLPPSLAHAHNRKSTLILGAAYSTSSTRKHVSKFCSVLHRLSLFWVLHHCGCRAVRSYKSNGVTR